MFGGGGGMVMGGRGGGGFGMPLMGGGLPGSGPPPPMGPGFRGLPSLGPGMGGGPGFGLGPGPGPMGGLPGMRHGPGEWPDCLVDTIRSCCLQWPLLCRPKQSQRSPHVCCRSAAHCPTAICREPLCYMTIAGGLMPRRVTHPASLHSLPSRGTEHFSHGRPKRSVHSAGPGPLRPPAFGSGGRQNGSSGGRGGGRQVNMHSRRKVAEAKLRSHMEQDSDQGPLSTCSHQP